MYYCETYHETQKTILLFVYCKELLKITILFMLRESNEISIMSHKRKYSKRITKKLLLKS